MNTSPMTNLAPVPPPPTGFPKPPTAYKLFCQKHHTDFSRKCAGGAAKDLLRMMKNAWKTLPENEKEWFQKEAERLKKIYQEKQAAATSFHTANWPLAPVQLQSQTRPVSPPIWEEFKVFEGQKYEDWTQCTPTVQLSDAEWAKAMESLY
ncbi:unnamed protein product [Caenorhabditis brenneri]